MPIYEFYCRDCNTVYSFFSARVAPEARPACPGCGRPELERRPSTFATVRARSTAGGEGEGEGGEDDSPLGGVDESRLESAMDALADEMGGLDESDDPRQMARFFRRFSELSGMEAGPRLEEMLRRLERGEDPEALEDEMGDAFDDEGAMDELLRVKKLAQARRKPKVDPTLHFL